MSIPFNEIPSNNRSPGVFGEFASGSPAGAEAKRVILMGLRTSAGTVSANTPTRVIGPEDGDAHHGPTSILAAMCRVFKAINADVDLWAMGITAASGAAAVGGIGLLGTATAAGELVFLLGGRRIALPVLVGDTGGTAGTLLAKLKALVAADLRGYFTDGTIASDALPLTFRVHGPEGNSASIKQVSANVPGITVSLTQPTGGTTAASMANPIAALGDVQYFGIGFGFNDATSMTALETEMDSRFTAAREIEGLVHTAKNGDLSTLTTFGDGRNNRHVVCWDAGLSPTPFWEVAAAALARDSQLSDPGQPRAALSLPGIIAPDAGDERTRAERNLLLADGIATLRVGPGSVVQIDRMATMYQENAQGIEDDTWRSGETMHIVSEYRQTLRRLRAEFETWKLVDDGTPLEPGVLAMTPSYMRVVIIGVYESFCRRGLMEGLEQFAASLIVERNATDRNRLDDQQRLNVGNAVVTIASKLIVTL